MLLRWATILSLLLGGGVARGDAQPPAEGFPTPRELAERIAKMQERHERMPKVAHIELAGAVQERPPDFSLFADPGALFLPSLIQRLGQAQADENVQAVLLTLQSVRLNLAQAAELRDALVQLRRAGKKAFVYADSYDTAGYTVATGADHICLLEAGELIMPGISLEAVFARGLLDKIGVQADYIQIGDFKGAAEQFTRTGASEEMRAELNKLLDGVYGQIVDGISSRRNLTRDEVQAVIDQAMHGAAEARRLGLVDHLVDLDGLRELIAGEFGEEVYLIRDYGIPDEPDLDFSNPFALLASLARQPERPERPVIALIHVEGMIIEGNGGATLFGGAVGSEDLRTAFREASRDEQIRGVVFRIDSPGGSPLASEIIWQSARRFGEHKPLVASVGASAASGGYYVATAAGHIIADDHSIVGSIGVVGGKLVVKDLFDNIGLTTESFQRGQNADLFSMTEPFDEHQRQIVSRWMRSTYDQFVDRVMTSRAEKIRDIDQVAQGRVFVAAQALEVGLVDELGGLKTAIERVAAEAGLGPGEYDLRILPAPRTLADLLTGMDGGLVMDPKSNLAAEAAARVLPRDVREGALRQSLLMQMLQRRPVVLVTPYIVRAR